MSISAELEQPNIVPEIGKFTPDNFRSTLIGLHNELLPDGHLIDFDADKNYMAEGIGGAMDGSAIRYPRRSDKEELLDYAVTKANECESQQDATILLAASVVAIHPFLDGNGRVSRALYSDMFESKRLNEEGTRSDSSNAENRKQIDLGSAFTQDHLLSKAADYYPYLKSGIDTKINRVGLFKPGVSDDLESITLTEDSIKGLDQEEVVDLVDAIGADEFGNPYRSDREGLVFAVNSITQHHPELGSSIKERSEVKIVNIHELLPVMSVEQKKEFVAALWQYRKLRAQGVIESIEGDFSKMTISRSVGKTTIGNLVIERTNNLQSSKIRH